jgi:hypothetical protein
MHRLYSTALAYLSSSLIALASPQVASAEVQAFPKDVQAVLTQQGCASARKQALANGALLITCTTSETTALDGQVRRLSYYVAQRQADGTFTTYKLVEYAEGSSPRTKVGVRHQVSVSGLHVQHSSSTEFGQVRSQTWDLGANPPVLIRESEGGNQDCREAVEVGGGSTLTPALVSPLCTTDFLHARQVCLRDAISCEENAIHITKVHAVSIPVRPVGAGGDPLSCAVTVGQDKTEVLLGQNRRGTSFRVVAEDDSAQRLMRLYLAANDKTPQLSPDGHAPADRYDHFELWLSSEPVQARCIEPGGQPAYCQERAQVQTLRVTLLPTQQRTVTIVAPLATPDRLTELHAQWGDKFLTVELHDELYKWSREGAVTLLYSDSETGAKRDNLISTTNSQSEHPETWGQWSSLSVCAPRPLNPIQLRTGASFPQ